MKSFIDFDEFENKVGLGMEKISNNQSQEEGTTEQVMELETKKFTEAFTKMLMERDRYLQNLEY